MADDLHPDEDDRITVGRPTGTVSSSRGGKRVMTVLVAVAAVLGFGVVMVYAYNKGKEDGTSEVPPIIQAQEGPSKIRPDNPGGMDVPNRDKEVFTHLEASRQTGSAERLLPPPEKPMEPPAALTATVPEEPTKKVQSAGADGKVRITLKPSLAKAPAVPKEIKALSATPPKAPNTAKKAPAAPNKYTAKTPAAKLRAVEKRKPNANTGAYRVQLASLKSRTAVQRHWAALKRKHPDLLGKMQLSIQFVELSRGRGAYYRMRAEPLRSREQAMALCSSLKKRKLDCIVVGR